MTDYPAQTTNYPAQTTELRTSDDKLTCGDDRIKPKLKMAETLKQRARVVICGSGDASLRRR